MICMPEVYSYYVRDDDFRKPRLFTWYHGYLTHDNFKALKNIVTWEWVGFDDVCMFVSHYIKDNKRPEKKRVMYDKLLNGVRYL